MTVAEPAATPVTTPFELTVAADALFVDQLIVWPVITLPCASLTVAVRATVAPTFIDVADGDTVTVVTTGGGGGAAVTVRLELPDFPDDVAVIVAEPAATPVATPADDTVAADALFVDHVIA